ncbi:MAG: NUDIX hydrolase [bacterium]|nr:NUDIX hydrolase [bacterium]
MFTKPKKASTLILLRRKKHQTNHGFEVLMLLRHRNNKFVPSNYVFPGGAMEEDDLVSPLEQLCSGITRKDAEAAIPDIGSPEEALGAWVAAIRETFEEASLLLAYTREGTMLSVNTEAEKRKFQDYRKRLYVKDLSFNDMLEQEELTLAADRIKYFSHWVTPVFSSIRYDARFFVAEAPENQEVFHDGHEVVKQLWIEPGEALKRHKQGDLKMVLPTVSTLRALNDCRTVEEVLSS